MSSDIIGCSVVSGESWVYDCHHNGAAEGSLVWTMPSPVATHRATIVDNNGPATVRPQCKHVIHTDDRHSYRLTYNNVPLLLSINPSNSSLRRQVLVCWTLSYDRPILSTEILSGNFVKQRFIQTCRIFYIN